MSNLLSQSEISRMYKSSNTDNPSHVYYNVRLSNVNNDVEPVAEYRTNTTSTIIEEMSEYDLTCPRFDIPTQSIPSFIVPIQNWDSVNLNTNPNKTIYQITFTYDSVDYSAPIIFIPENKREPVPANLSAGNPNQDVSSRYYWLFSYQSWCDMVNTCLTSIYNLMKTAVPAITFGPPTLIFNSTSGTFSLLCPQAGYDINVAPKPTIIWFNYALAGVLDNFYYNDYGLSALGKNMQLIVKSYGNNLANNILTITQEYPSLIAFNSFKSIVLTTDTIPIISESLPSHQVFGTTPDNTVLTYKSIITDMIPNYAVGNEHRGGTITYTPSFYRSISMNGKGALKKFSLSIYWTDQYGVFHPLTIPKNTAVSCKFLFKQRGLAN